MTNEEKVTDMRFHGVDPAVAFLVQDDAGKFYVAKRLTDAEIAELREEGLNV